MGTSVLIDGDAGAAESAVVVTIAPVGVLCACSSSDSAISTGSEKTGHKMFLPLL